MQSCFKNPIFKTPGLPLLKPSKTQIRNFIVCGGKKRRQSFLNRKASKLILETALTVASNLNVIPQPLTDMIREFGGVGGGGGIGIRKGGGGGGFEWWRRRARKLGFILLVVVTGLGLCVGKKVYNDVVLCGIVFALFAGLVCFGDFKVKDWFLRVCIFAGFVYLLGTKREQMRRSVNKFRSCVTDSRLMKQLLNRKNA